MTPTVLPSFGVRVCHSASERPIAKAARARAPCSRRVARALARALVACAGVAIGVDVFVMRVIYQEMKSAASPDPVILGGARKWPVRAIRCGSAFDAAAGGARCTPWQFAVGRTPTGPEGVQNYTDDGFEKWSD